MQLFIEAARGGLEGQGAGWKVVTRLQEYPALAIVRHTDRRRLRL